MTSCPSTQDSSLQPLTLFWILHTGTRLLMGPGPRAKGGGSTFCRTLSPWAHIWNDIFQVGRELRSPPAHWRTDPSGTGLQGVSSLCLDFFHSGDPPLPTAGFHGCTAICLSGSRTEGSAKSGGPRLRRGPAILTG